MEERQTERLKSCQSKTFSVGAFVATHTPSVAHAAFERVVQDWPHEHFILRQGIMPIREHNPQKNRVHCLLNFGQRIT